MVVEEELLAIPPASDILQRAVLRPLKLKS
jgi:hypothetical protein